MTKKLWIGSVIAMAAFAQTGLAAEKFTPNYDEAKVPPYTLPDPLIMRDGRKVTDAQMWRQQRRPEILAMFRTLMYGKSPERPANMTFKQFDLDKNALGGKAVRKQVTIYFTGKQDGPSVNLLIYLPKSAPTPPPIFVNLNFEGNQAAINDPAIRLSTSWRDAKRENTVNNQATEASRGTEASRMCIEPILARGYGVVTAHYCDIDPDFDDGFKNGVHGAFDKFEGKRPADAWGSIGAWAWGLSRALDYLETDHDVDAKRAIVVGLSRLGKTALWAGAQDERFAMVVSTCSGCGGAALSKRIYGETVGSMNRMFPHWLCENSKQFNEHEQDLPLDQHMLIALIAPRPVYISSAEQDRWADPKGEFLSALNADPVYRLLGTDGLAAKEMPEIEKPVTSTIGYHIRHGVHDATEYDWQRYMDAADRHLRKPTATWTGQ